MSKKKKVLIWVVVIVALISLVSLYFYATSNKNQPEYTVAPVEKGSVVQTVSVTGDIIDDGEIILNFEIGGRIKDVFAKVGQRFAQGEVISILNDADLTNQAEQAKNLFDKAVADSASNDDAIQVAQTEEENAKKYFDDTKDYQQQKVLEADQGVKNAENYRDDALNYYNEDKSYTRKLTLTTADNNVKTAKENKKSTEEQADLSKTSAENSWNMAKARLDSAKSNFAQESLDAVVANARLAYEQSELNLAKANLKAPINGTITEINNKKGEVLGSGTIKESFAKMLSGDLLIEARVPESDILKLKEGMKANFTLDALSEEEKFGAEIIEISPAGTANQDVISYTVKFRADKLDSRFKAGMTANIDIRTAEKNNTLSIPLRAIKTESGQKYVEVLKDNNQTEKIEITTGLEGDEGMVEVKSGLEEGEKVVTGVKNP